MLSVYVPPRHLLNQLIDFHTMPLESTHISCILISYNTYWQHGGPTNLLRRSDISAT